MFETVEYELGKQIAHFRKLLKMSADELAEKAGFGLTRSIVANLENGRKEDVTVRQLIAMAFVLEVQPADLIFPLKQPYKRIEIANGESNVVLTPMWLARDWFTGTASRKTTSSLLNGEPMLHPPGFGYSENEIILIDLRKRSELLEQLDLPERGYRLAPQRKGFTVNQTAKFLYQRDQETNHANLYRVENRLRAAGVNLENPIGPSPETPF
ncbi:helix-turn-helix transcriptional regulator [Cryobacterium sp. GrIS_2_6]|uniref:helix-turn-helix domain-containing protein n=1 Tax=Cryobacterium sp. GrIS_2_6 TaxID=3162785 RepID=UPI002E057DA9|nr:transcriptional regulator with XRE-family HTH domain [Cryobacterium psychrotolerans]